MKSINILYLPGDPLKMSAYQLVLAYGYCAGFGSGYGDEEGRGNGRRESYPRAPQSDGRLNGSGRDRDWSDFLI